MTAFVVDASVAAKWCLPSEGESLVPQARQLLDAYCRGQLRLVVPDLFWAELGNVLWKAVRMGRTSQDGAASGLALARNLNLPTYASFDLIEDALQIGFTYERSVYDSLYLALAVQYSIDLITADERLANSLAARMPVKWLGAI